LKALLFNEWRMLMQNWGALRAAVFAMLVVGTPVMAQSLPADIDPRTLSRVPEVKRSAMTAEGQAIYDKVAGANRTTPMLGPGGVSLHMPKVAQAMDILNQYLRYDSIIGRRYIEVAILVAAREFDQQYEWTFHEKAALSEGAPKQTVDAIRNNGPLDALDAKDRVIIQYGREILGKHHLSSATWAETEAQFTQQGALEIAAIMGDYLLAAVLLHAVDQRLPANMPPTMPEKVPAAH
jgi:4-carboxymuconolactone decarboxylase